MKNSKISIRKFQALIHIICGLNLGVRKKICVNFRTYQELDVVSLNRIHLMYTCFSKTLYITNDNLRKSLILEL